MPVRPAAKKSLVPTVGLAVGMLLGGSFGAVCGAWIGYEMAVVVLYFCGTMTGALVGSLIGYRWHNRACAANNAADDATSAEQLSEQVVD